MSEEVGIEITDEAGAAVVAFKTASISSAEDITGVSEKISKFIEENHPKKIVGDFEGVRFFCSQVLGLLLEMRAKLKTYGGEVEISGINPQLYRIFKITHLDKIFRFFPDRESAVKAISAD